MRITVINGVDNDNFREHELALENLKLELSKDHKVDLFTVRNMKIAYCCGCFGCWTKTPGQCIFKDDMEYILKSMASSNFIVYVSPITAGFITSQTKKVMDRFIPNALPYINIYNNECHHPKRYDSIQGLGLVILEDNLLDEEAVQITKNIFQRFSLNMHANKYFESIVKPGSIRGLINEFSNC